ncbi:HD domain-containing protein [Pedobacter jejuensis]|uniref:HD domain-containing protein n=1 Tax=Pedobacter jejuensis TaxID=1268550 RepID=A0A3N0BU01_9SPHI|nr:HD domain-containing protein [Pedobacter jejuensis]RNL52508.1 HD domain-containing protein [Pedobacter jejuensis]
MREVTRKANLFVDKLLNERLPLSMYFHNYRHTVLVLKAVTEIGNHSILTDIEKCTLQLAALFHDVGYTETYMGHEDVSIQIAAEFLKGENISDEIIDSVCKCIDATRFPQKPKDRLGMIICDADFYHLSLVDYPLYAENLKKEWQENLGIVYSAEKWDMLNVSLLSSHQYFVPYARKALEKGKQLNIKKLLNNSVR